MFSTNKKLRHQEDLKKEKEIGVMLENFKKGEKEILKAANE